MQIQERTETMMTPIANAYQLPRNGQERRRLQIQGLITNPLTEALFVRAGITRGMRVLDLGCGVGDVSMIAARLVGPTGSVIGVDSDAVALDAARTRAFDAGLDNVTFWRRDICCDAMEGTFDAVVGRHILIHMREPLQTLRQAASLLRPGGVAVFQEYDTTVKPPTCPELRLFNRMMTLAREVIARIVPYPNMGSQVFRFLEDAGLERPVSQAEFAMDGGSENLVCEWLAESMRSILPHLEASGLITARELNVDTLAERLRHECQFSSRRCTSLAMVVGTYARKPF